MTHDELVIACERWLRRCKNRITWTNMRMDVWGTGRPDVLSITRVLHMKRCRPQVHEIKVSRSDFFSDVRTGKWRKYQPFCQGFYFVTPKGLVVRGEVPEGAGLIEYDHERQPFFDAFREVARPSCNREWKFDEPLLMRMILGRWGTEPPQPTVYVGDKDQ